jgi:inner membrane protein
LDPLSQGVLGASLPQALNRGERAAVGGLFGCLGGMAPDLDVLIRSSSDPLLFLEYHRQFTHALIFIPFGGVICGLVLYWLLGRRWQLSMMESCLYATLGYATHALLDACTTYGTQLLWPFTDARFAWNTVSVIDPLFTLPILALVVTAGLRKRPLFARLALAWALIYLSMGLVQRDASAQRRRVFRDMLFGLQAKNGPAFHRPNPHEE